MARLPKAPGRAAVVLARPNLTAGFPDPPMVPTVALRQCEAAATVEEVRAIVARYVEAKP